MSQAIVTFLSQATCSLWRIQTLRMSLSSQLLLGAMWREQGMEQEVKLLGDSVFRVSYYDSWLVRH